MVCRVGSTPCPCCIVILTPGLSDACNSGTPRRSNQVDEKLTARLHIDDQEIVGIRLVSRLFRVKHRNSNKWDRPGRAPSSGVACPRGDPDPRQKSSPPPAAQTSILERTRALRWGPGNEIWCSESCARRARCSAPVPGPETGRRVRAREIEIAV